MPRHLLVEWFSTFFPKSSKGDLQATTTFRKWHDVIVGVTGDLVDAVVSYVKRIDYAVFFEEVAKRNPLKCCFCGEGMELVHLFHPDRGLFFYLLAPADG